MTTSSLHVRRATESDLVFVSQDGYLSDRIVRRKIADGDVFLALRGDERVGYLRLEYLWAKLPYIELIRVLEPHRRAGVGRGLLNFVESTLAADGRPILYSSSQANEPEPQAWHRHMGFEECGFLAGVNDDGIGEVFFRKKIVPREE